MYALTFPRRFFSAHLSARRSRCQPTHSAVVSFSSFFPSCLAPLLAAVLQVAHANQGELDGLRPPRGLPGTLSFCPREARQQRDCRGDRQQQRLVQRQPRWQPARFAGLVRRREPTSGREPEPLRARDRSSSTDSGGPPEPGHPKDPATHPRRSGHPEVASYYHSRGKRLKMEKLDPACASGSEGAEASGLAAATAAAAFFLCRCWTLVFLSRSCCFFRTRARFACWRRFVERGARGRGQGEAQPPIVALRSPSHVCLGYPREDTLFVAGRNPSETEEAKRGGRWCDLWHTVRLSRPTVACVCEMEHAVCLALGQRQPGRRRTSYNHDSCRGVNLLEFGGVVLCCCVCMELL